MQRAAGGHDEKELGIEKNLFAPKVFETKKMAFL
jgi:hypothetical protein